MTAHPREDEDVDEAAVGHGDVGVSLVAAQGYMASVAVAASASALICGLVAYNWQTCERRRAFPESPFPHCLL